MMALARPSMPFDCCERQTPKNWRCLVTQNLVCHNLAINFPQLIDSSSIQSEVAALVNITTHQWTVFPLMF